jgi:hypothetical protein
MSKGQYLSVFQRLTNGVMHSLGLDDRGALRTASEPWTGLEAVDLSTTDALYTSVTGWPRSIRITGAGNVKVDCKKGDGAANAGLVIGVTDFDQLDLSCVTKIYKIGTTATGLFVGF